MQSRRGARKSSRKRCLSERRSRVGSGIEVTVSEPPAVMNSLSLFFSFSFSLRFLVASNENLVSHQNLPSFSKLAESDRDQPIRQIILHVEMKRKICSLVYR